MRDKQPRVVADRKIERNTIRQIFGNRKMKETYNLRQYNRTLEGMKLFKDSMTKEANYIIRQLEYVSLYPNKPVSKELALAKARKYLRKIGAY